MTMTVMLILNISLKCSLTTCSISLVLLQNRQSLNTLSRIQDQGMVFVYWSFLVIEETVDPGTRGAEWAAVPPKRKQCQNHVLMIKWWATKSKYEQEYPNNMKTIENCTETGISDNSEKQADLYHIIVYPRLLFATSVSSLHCIIINHEAVYSG